MEPLTREQLNTIKQLLLRNLVIQASVDPTLEEMLRGRTIQLEVHEVPTDQGAVPADAIRPKLPPKPEVDESIWQALLAACKHTKVSFTVLPLPYVPGNRFTHEVVATLSNGRRQCVSQHKSLLAAHRRKAWLEKHGLLVDELLHASGGTGNEFDDALE